VKYKSPTGELFNLYGQVEHDMYADLVAALLIARAYKAKCERLESMNDRLRQQVDKLNGELVVATLKASEVEWAKYYVSNT
jgi:hypothetical protein